MNYKIFWKNFHFSVNNIFLQTQKFIKIYRPCKLNKSNLKLFFNFFFKKFKLKNNNNYTRKCNNSNHQHNNKIYNNHNHKHKICNKILEWANNNPKSHSKIKLLLIRQKWCKLKQRIKQSFKFDVRVAIAVNVGVQQNFKINSMI